MHVLLSKCRGCSFLQFIGRIFTRDNRVSVCSFRTTRHDFAFANHHIFLVMIIPVNLPSSSNSENETTFPPQLAKLGTKEVILLELQGSVQTEGDRDGQLVGTLKIDEKVSMVYVSFWSPILQQSLCRPKSLR